MIASGELADLSGARWSADFYLVKLEGSGFLKRWQATGDFSLWSRTEVPGYATGFKGMGNTSPVDVCAWSSPANWGDFNGDCLFMARVRGLSTTGQVTPTDIKLTPFTVFFDDSDFDVLFLCHPIEYP